MALIVRGILGAGIQDLPGSLTADGPITTVPMALTTVGALALLSRRAATGRRQAVRLRPGPRPASAGSMRQRLVIQDDRVDRQHRDHARLALIQRAFHQHRRGHRPRWSPTA